MTITNGYTTLNAVKAALRIPVADTTDDTLIENAINSASRLIDGYCSRQFFNAGTAARYFAPSSELVCEVDDLAGTAITVATDPMVDGSFDLVWSPSDYQLEPLNGILDGQTWAYTRVRAAMNYLFPRTNDLALVKVTGVWGWPAVPDAVETACIIQSQRLFKRFDSPLGVAGFGDMGAIRVSRTLDADVGQLVEAYKRSRSFA